VRWQDKTNDQRMVLMVETAMTITHAALSLIVPGLGVLAIAVNVAALLGWLKRRWR
jgi:hypothetical protein